MMDINLTTILLYAAGIITVLVVAMAGTAMSQVLGVRVHRPRIRLIKRDEIPDYLQALYEEPVKQLSELGFEYHHSQLSRDLVAHEQADKWNLVMVHREKKVFAEISPASTFLDMPGCEIDFWSFAKDGTALISVNGRSHTILCDIPGAVLHDPFAETIANQYYAHCKEQKRFSVIREIVQPVPASYIKLQQSLMDAYFIKLMRERIVASTGKNEFRIAFAKSFGLLYQIVTGEKQVQKLLITRQNKIAHLDLINPDEHAEMGNNTHYPAEAEMQAYLRLNSLRNRHSAGTSTKIILFALTLLVSYFAFGLVFSYHSVLIILGVLLFHELGHIAAMYMFGYRDLQILFVPLLGAAALGKNENAAAWKQVIIYFMGPLPGIVVALFIFASYDNINHAPPWLYETALIMLVINYLNLLPFLPLDGGRILQRTVMDRFPTGKFLFSMLSGLAFAAGGYFLGEPVFWVLAVIMLLSLPAGKLETSVLRAFYKQVTEFNQMDTHAKLRALFETLKLPQFKRLNFADKFNVANAVREIVLQPAHAGMFSSLILLTIYVCIVLATPPAFFVTAIGLESAASIVPLIVNADANRNWDVDIAKARDTAKRFDLTLAAAQHFALSADHTKALSYLKRAETEADLLQQDETYASLHEAYWLHYQAFEKIALAHDSLLKAIQFKEKATQKNAYRLTLNYQDLATLNELQSDHEARETNLLTALSYAGQIENPQQRYLITTILTQLNEIYFDKQQLDLAVAVLQNSLSDTVKYSDRYNLYITRFIYFELGWMHYHMHNYDSALQQFSFALRVDDQFSPQDTSKDIESVNAIDPTLSPQIYLAIATIQAIQGKLSLADANYTNAEQALSALQFESLTQYIASMIGEQSQEDLISIYGKYEYSRWQLIAKTYQERLQASQSGEAVVEIGVAD